MLILRAPPSPVAAFLRTLGTAPALGSRARPQLPCCTCSPSFCTISPWPWDSMTFASPG